MHDKELLVCKQWVFRHHTVTCVDASFTADPPVWFRPAPPPSQPLTTALWPSQTAAPPQPSSPPPLHCRRRPGQNHPAATARQRSHGQKHTSRTTQIGFSTDIFSQRNLTGLLFVTYSGVEIRCPGHDGVCDEAEVSYLNSLQQHSILTLLVRAHFTHTLLSVLYNIFIIVSIVREI